MNKLRAAILLVSFWIMTAGLALAQTTLYTPNLHLGLPPAAPGTWGETYNGNFTILDTAVASGGVTDTTCPAGQKVSSIVAGVPTCTPTTLLNESLYLVGVLSPPQIVANTNDYAPANLGTASTLYINTDASRNLTGITGGATGRVLILYNNGTQNIVLINESGLSSAINRLAINANITLGPAQGIIIQYDGVATRWRAASGVSGAGGQAADNDLTAIAALSGTGFATRTTTDTWAQRTMTGTASNISITNGDGIKGDPTWDVGPNVALTTRGFTLGNFDFDLGAAASLTIPKAAGGTTTTEGRIITNTTSHRAIFGNGTVAKTFAFTDEIQPLNTNLTGISSVIFATNQFALFHGSAWTNPTIPDCRGATDVLQFNNTTGVFPCTTLSVSGLSGGTNNQFLVATGTNTYASTANLTQTGSVINVPGGAVFGNCGTDCISWNTGGYTGHGAVTLTIPYVGGAADYLMTTGARTPGQILIIGANGQAVQGGAAGTGDVTLNGAQVLTNKTIDEAGPNTIKTTKSVQLTAFGPSEDNTTGSQLAVFRVPVSLNGTNLIGVQANVTTAGTTGTLTFQVARCAATATGNVCSGTVDNMLSTAVTIDSGENSTTTAATPAVIDASKDDVATGQIISINVSAIHGTPAKGLLVNLDFKLP